MPETYRVGIVGAGGISRAHTSGYFDSEHTEIVAVADINEEQLEKYGEQFKVTNLYTDFLEMVKTENPDIVSVCTWEHTHCEVVVNVTQYVQGILCEKPMARSLGDADKMIEACDKTGTKLAIGHQRRFAAQHLKARQLLKAGEIGELRFAWISSPPPLIGWGTHVADLARYYLGDVEFVMGQIDGGESKTAGYLKFTNGLRALFETESGQHRLHFFGEDGEIEVMVDGGLRVKAKGSSAWTQPELTGTHPFRDEINELVAAIEEDREHLNSGREGRAALEVLMAILESARSRKSVALPLEVKENPLQLMKEAGEL